MVWRVGVCGWVVVAGGSGRGGSDGTRSPCWQVGRARGVALLSPDPSALLPAWRLHTKGTKQACAWRPSTRLCATAARPPSAASIGPHLLHHCAAEICCATAGVCSTEACNARRAAAAAASSPHTTHHTPHTTRHTPHTTRLHRHTTPATSRHVLALTLTPIYAANNDTRVLLPCIGSYRAGTCSGTTNGYRCEQCDNAVCRGKNTYRTGACSSCMSR